MSVPEQSTSFSSRLGALIQRLGLAGRASRNVLEQASQLRLPFQPLPSLQDSIWWQAGAPLQRLVDLPRSALSGPVQEDKANAHAVLIRLVQLQQEHHDSYDLRQINGLSCSTAELPHFASLEEYAASPACRGIRIISYKDFLKAINQALPRFLAGEPISLNQAGWLGERLFWSGEQHPQAFSCAIAYARLRGLEITLPADISRYRINPAGLHELQQRYHVLAMPAQTWSDPTFMSLLLNDGLPYSRLALLRTPGAHEFLLLPKDHLAANALGEGLRLAGAADVVAHLQQLPH